MSALSRACHRRRARRPRAHHPATRPRQASGLRRARYRRAHQDCALALAAHWTPPGMLAPRVLRQPLGMRTGRWMWRQMWKRTTRTRRVRGGPPDRRARRWWSQPRRRRALARRARGAEPEWAKAWGLAWAAASASAREWAGVWGSLWLGRAGVGEAGRGGAALVAGNVPLLRVECSQP